ncbi:Intramolecular chaperone auto-processing domain containing protein [uncultured Caudovirales phage]|uniref:Intramolecular chaperone auto-processing domain containing protein n=1 Tax=uncultured Caudovirales phage TaxID=2100421 RepID=A0A6J5LFY4_9CAUD|nr:Intramolecular chaperone auto-processing domain containing protein [uncultured Caudovirales phage]
MAASGFTPILIYGSTTASNVPLAANLTTSASGVELAINAADGKLYFKNSSGVVTLLAGSGGGGPAAGSNTQIQFNNSGVFGASANLTWSGTVLSTTGLTATGAITLNTTTNNQSYTTTGAGTITISSGTAGSINNMNIGATTAGTGKFTSLTNSGLTSGRVVYSTTGGLETDSANLTFDGTTLSAAGLSDSGNLTFTGTGNRITGDFSNATIANRAMLQGSVSNSGTVVTAIPNGTSASAQLVAANASDPTNAQIAQVFVSASEASFRSAAYGTGTGTYLPMTFYTSGSEKLRIAADTTGTYTFGGTAPRITGDTNNATVSSRLFFQSSTTNGSTSFGVLPNGTSLVSGYQAYNNSDPTNAAFAQLATSAGTEVRLTSGISGTGTYLPMTFYTGGSERMRLDTSGNLGIGTASSTAKLSVNGGTSTSQIRWEVNNAAYVQEVSTNAAQNAYVYKMQDASYYTWKISGTEQMRIDSSGNVGIGTSSFSLSNTGRGLLEINGSSDSIIGWKYGGTVAGYIQGQAAAFVINSSSTLPLYLTAGGTTQSIVFQTNATERMRIDSSGNVGIGTSSPTYKVDVAGSVNSNTSVNVNNTGTTANILFASSGQTGTTVRSNTVARIQSTAAGRDVNLQFSDNVSNAAEVGMLSGALYFATAGAERMRIDSSGNVGIGTSSPSTYGKFVISSTGAAQTILTGTDNGNGFIQYYGATGRLGYVGFGDSSSNLYFSNDKNAASIFLTNATERMRINSSGYVGIGASTTAQLRSQLTVLGAGQATAALSDSGNTDGTIQINSNVNSGGRGGALTFGALLDNASYTPFAALKGLLSNGGGNGVGDLAFSTRNATGDTALTERMRIDSSGNLLVNRTSQFTAGQYSADFGGNTRRGATYNNTDGNTGANFVSFGTTGTVIGTISQVSTTGVLYNTTSDQRLKENIQDAESASALIDSLQVRQFDWKSDNSHQRYGFVAQELVTVAPEAVHQPNDPEEMMAVDYSKLVPMLVKEIQSLRKRLAALEST